MTADVMSQCIIVNRYLDVCRAFSSNVPFTAKSSVGSPDGSPFDAEKLRAVVNGRKALLPATYRDAYVTPLLTQLPNITARLQYQYNLDKQRMSEQEALSNATVMMDTLVGAVRDWGEPVYRGALARFEAVASNLYRSFLSKEQRANVSLPLVEIVPPLVTFAATAKEGPFTMPADAVMQNVGANVGIVSLPWAYADHPLLWPALAHETGGHDVLHADPGLLNELGYGVRMFLNGAMGNLWAAWIEETASDVYGLLNVGPSFALSFAALLAAIEGTHETDQSEGRLGSVLFVQNGQLLDPHPVNLLRLYVARGAVGALVGLSVPTRQRWISVIDTVAQAASGGASSIKVFDVGTKSVIQELSLAQMASAAMNVGAFIAMVRLHSLGGHSIQETETWDDRDEAIATQIAATAASGSIVGMGDDAQQLAGATMALFTDPSKYAAITQNLTDALDDSFARDPIFGTPAPHSALGPRALRRMGARTPGALRFPIPL